MTRDRKFVRVMGYAGNSYNYTLAVADDGTAWKRANVLTEGWEQLPPLPPIERRVRQRRHHNNPHFSSGRCAGKPDRRKS